MDIDDLRSESFLEELPFSHRQTDDGIVGELEVTENLLVPGHQQVRIAALASVADVITGVLVNSRTHPLLALTVDLAVRIIEPVGTGRLDLTSRVVKLGRSLSATEAMFRRDGRLVAHSWATFMASPRPQDTLPGLLLSKDRGAPEMAAPFADALGLVVVEPGVVEVQRTPYTRQSAGTLQGGVVCALAELAAETGTGQPVSDIDVRYLSTIRTGPGRAVAHGLDASLTQVTVTDAGRDDDKVAAIAFTRSPTTTA